MTLWPQFAQPRIKAYLWLQRTIINFFPLQIYNHSCRKLKEAKKKEGKKITSDCPCLEIMAAVKLYNNELIITFYVFVFGRSLWFYSKLWQSCRTNHSEPQWATKWQPTFHSYTAAQKCTRKITNYEQHSCHTHKRQTTHGMIRGQNQASFLHIHSLLLSMKANILLKTLPSLILVIFPITEAYIISKSRTAFYKP